MGSGLRVRRRAGTGPLLLRLLALPLVLVLLAWLVCTGGLRTPVSLRPLLLSEQLRLQLRLPQAQQFALLPLGEYIPEPIRVHAPRGRDGGGGRWMGQPRRRQRAG